MKTGMEPTSLVPRPLFPPTTWPGYEARNQPTKAEAIWCYCIHRYNKRSLQNHYSYGARITTVRDHKPEAGYEANVEDCMTHVHGSDTENRSSFFLTYGWQ